MNRNTLLIGTAIVAAIVGGVFLARRLKSRNLPEGPMIQTTSSAESETPTSPIPGRPQVKVTTTSGKAVVELHPEVDNAAVAALLAKLSREECTSQTVADCGLIGKDYIQVVFGQLLPDAKISSILILGK